MKSHHLTNQELRQLRRHDRTLIGATRQEHFAHCEECQLAFRLLALFPVAGRPPLVHAPEYMITRAAEIAATPKRAAISDTLRAIADLIFDSWASPLPAGVRGSAHRSRRMRFQSAYCQLDLQASRTTRGWECTARLVPKGNESSQAVRCRVGCLTLQPDEAGFVSWKSSRPPQRVTVSSDSTVLLQAELTWGAPTRA